MPYALEQCGPTLALRAYAAACAEADARGLGRKLPWPHTLGNLRVDFSRNDYLGLAHSAALAATASRAARRWGVGATGSRLLSGDHAAAHVLERRIARTLGAQAALVFPSGYQLNAAVGAALFDRSVLGGEPTVICDRNMHASAYAAFTAAGIRPLRYRHNNLTDLACRLDEASRSGAPLFVVTESLFSMDGDVTDVDAVQRLATQYGALVFLDEAHAIGMLGPKGYGLGRAVIDAGGVVMGTFSKAIGGAGAYLACSAAIRDYLLQRCAGFIYTTGLPPPTLAAAWHAWTMLPQLDAAREHVFLLAGELRCALHAAGFSTGDGTTQIVPIIIGDVARTMAVRDALALEGLVVSAIRPPTVAPNAARLRVIVNATHTRDEIAALILALRRHA